MRERFDDFMRLAEHGRALRSLASDPAPSLRLLAGPPPAPGERLGLLAGSFNPPTLAHTSLAEAGLASGALDRVWFSLSTRTVDKEVVSGALLEDRLLLLDLLVDENARLGTVGLNRGLYVDQARILRAAYPDIGALVFLVGHDKIVQIFDPRYYDDRDAALAALFELSTFMVAPRGDGEGPALAALLDQPENRRFAHAVQPLDLPPALRDVASSSVRTDLADGSLPSGMHERVPPVVARFIAATGVYADEDRYRQRAARIEQATPE
ncbi:MAG: hypothetical protein IT306_04010 [Chloroflexi bacterium]|nr:hypothetical protein [Chloroflexota bacterium]